MEFKTKEFYLSIQGLNKKLGISKNAEIDYYKSAGLIIWNSDITYKEWGIKSIMSYINSCDIDIEYSIEKETLTSKDTQQLLSLELGEFYPVNQTLSIIHGKIRINGKDYKINNQMEFDGDKLTINEVIIDFDDNEITIL